MDPGILRARIGELYRSVKPLDASTDITSTHHAHVATKLDEVATEAERDIFPAASASPDGDLKDEAARLYRQLAISNSWLNDREERTRRWIDRAAELASSEILRDLVVAEQNNLRDAQAFPEIRGLCQQGMVDKARRVLQKRRRESRDPVMRRRIDEFLAEPRNFLAPLGTAPTMTTINGFGTMLYGSRDGRGDGTYVSTLCLVALFLPLFPLRAYLVQPQGGNSYVFYGRVPLSAFAYWWRKLMVIAPMVAALGIWSADAWNSSPTIRESGHLSEASGCLNRRDYPGALTSLSRMAGTRDAGRAAQLDGLFSRTLTEALAPVQTPDDAVRFLGSMGTLAGRMKRPLSKEAGAAIESALGRITTKPLAGTVTRNFIVWMGTMSPEFASRLPEIAVAACGSCDDPALLAAAVEFHLEAGRPFPGPLLARLADHLKKARHSTWSSDTLSYLKTADPASAAPVLHARTEAAWKGAESGADLLAIKSLPPLLRLLIELDAEPNLEKRAAALEKAAAPDGLAAPLDGWHRLGVARRLSKAFGSLNEKDPIRFPVAKARPWAILAAELAPEDLGSRRMALRYLIEDGDYARAIALGSKGTDDPKIATLVGIALARSGKPEEAAMLLRPLVLRDFPEYSKSVEAWEKAVGSKSEALWKTLENGTANRAVISRLNSLPQEQASKEAAAWVRREVERDPWIAQLRSKWSDKADIHPAASELAMVELSIGQSLRPGAERKARLEAAERLFLDLQKVSGDDPHQELLLGQVYFWLGKDKEGQEIFDRLEKSGDTHVIKWLGDIYRTLARFDAARRVLEKAYDKADGKEKGNIASLRAFSTNDYADRLVWLRKADPADPQIRVEIDSCEARLALAAGRYDAAVAPLQRAVAYYAGLPESAMSLNNGSIVQKELGRATGDPKPTLEALRMLRRAYELVPEDGIILSNYINDLQGVGFTALAGTALRTDLLHAFAERGWMDFVVPTVPVEEWAARVKAQPEMRRSAELAVKSVILSPDGSTGYMAQITYLSLTQDVAGLRKLREAVESRPPVRGEDSAEDQAHARGEYTESERKQHEASVARWDGLLPSIRKAGHAPTLAYALRSSAYARHLAARLGLAGQKFETALQEAEEAVRVFDSPPTREAVAWLRAEQAGKAVAAADEEFARWAKENPSLSETYLLPLYVRKHPDRAAAVRQREEVRRATDEMAAYENSKPRKKSAWSWSWLDMAGHDARETARKAIESHPTVVEWDRLRFLINPHSPAEALEAWLSATASGDGALAARIAAQADGAGLIPRFFRK